MTKYIDLLPVCQKAHTAPLLPSLQSQAVSRAMCLVYFGSIYISTSCQWAVTLSLQCLQEPFVRSLSSYHFHGATSPFDRRITCLEWHPTHPTTLAVASKGGDIYLWDFEVPTKKTFIQGVSPWMTNSTRCSQQMIFLNVAITLCIKLVPRTITFWGCNSFKNPAN